MVRRAPRSAAERSEMQRNRCRPSRIPSLRRSRPCWRYAAPDPTRKPYAERCAGSRSCWTSSQSSRTCYLDALPSSRCAGGQRSCEGRRCEASSRSRPRRSEIIHVARARPRSPRCDQGAAVPCRTASSQSGGAPHAARRDLARPGRSEGTRRFAATLDRPRHRADEEPQADSCATMSPPPVAHASRAA